MDQQQQGPGSLPAANDSSSIADLPPAQSNRSADDSWGMGAQTALDSLRRQNFRGKRDGPTDERPASD